ncbi:MAG TPA: hypothetical protein VN799_09205 [Acidimicrobiales bacterium]|nr:hypothetical protein [Acidimicrobiales bacterium]
MTTARRDPQRRAERLMRWYPKTWRARYGDEFSELLTAELSERPRSWRRAADVAWSGVFARLTSAGLTAHSLEPHDQVRAGLATLAGALAVFLVFGTALWSQLTIGWQWAEPNTIGTSAAMVAMSAVLLLFVVLATLALAPLGWSVVRRLGRRHGGGLVRPSLLLGAGLVLLVVGARHFGNGWPGTGGHHWAHQGLVPGGVAAFLWALTLSISSYWAHPGALLSFPPAEVGWMIVSPLAIVCAAVGVTKIVRRLDMSPRLQRYEARLGNAAAAAAAAYLVASSVWIVDGGPGPRNLFHAGAIDTVGLAVMAAAAAVALRTAHRACHAGTALITS